MVTNWLLIHTFDLQVRGEVLTHGPSTCLSLSSHKDLTSSYTVTNSQYFLTFKSKVKFQISVKLMHNDDSLSRAVKHKDILICCWSVFAVKFTTSTSQHQQAYAEDKQLLYLNFNSVTLVKQTVREKLKMNTLIIIIYICI